MSMSRGCCGKGIKTPGDPLGDFSTRQAGLGMGRDDGCVGGKDRSRVGLWKWTGQHFADS